MYSKVLECVLSESRGVYRIGMYGIADYADYTDFADKTSTTYRIAYMMCILCYITLVRDFNRVICVIRVSGNTMPNILHTHQKYLETKTLHIPYLMKFDNQNR